MGATMANRSAHAMANALESNGCLVATSCRWPLDDMRRGHEKRSFFLLALVRPVVMSRRAPSRESQEERRQKEPGTSPRYRKTHVARQTTVAGA